MMRRMKSRLMPDRGGGIDDELELRPFVRLGDRVASDRGGKAALWADGQPVEIDVAGCFLRAPPEIGDALQRRRLAADEPEHDALVLDETQRAEIAGPRRVVFEQEMIDARTGEE